MNTQHPVGHTIKLGNTTLIYQGKGPDGEDVWSSDFWRHVPEDFPAKSEKWNKRNKR